MPPTLETYLAQLRERPLPEHPMERVRALARELAEGAVYTLWDFEIGFAYLTAGEHQHYEAEYKALWARENISLPEERGYIPDSRALVRYFAERWKQIDVTYPMRLLFINGYVQFNSENRFRGSYTLLKPAFDLIGQGAAARVFISYRRGESSAFALLVLARLKAAGLDVFLDMAIVPGENWQEDLRGRIGASDTFILILGKTSLESDVVLDEISHAMRAGVRILPVWHNGFVFRGDGVALPAKMTAMLETTHTIRVLEESALGYNNALVELLNYFGETP